MDYTKCSTPANMTTSNDGRGLVKKPVNLKSPYARRSIRFTIETGTNKPKHVVFPHCKILRVPYPYYKLPGQKVGGAAINDVSSCLKWRVVVVLLVGKVLG